MTRKLLFAVFFCGMILNQDRTWEKRLPTLVMGKKIALTVSKKKNKPANANLAKKFQTGIQKPMLPAFVPKICAYAPLLNNDCMDEKRWYYDADLRLCLPFQSGSECDANGNNFPTRKICNHVCKTNVYTELDIRSTTEWRCGAPRVNHKQCKPFVWPNTRFYYDQTLNRCLPFNAKGCAASNTFMSLDDCTFYCRQADAVVERVPRVGCKLPLVRGFEICYNGQARWYHNSTSHRCEWFMYSGCFGSWNNFLTYADCKLVCDAKGEPVDPCSLPPDVGTSFQYRPRYFFDQDSQACRPMSYSGFGGNANNFFVPEDCEAACIST